MMKTKEIEMTAPKLTKTALAIQTMNANTDRSMEEVIPMIAEASGVPLNIARNYYVWCVRKGVATGVVPVKAKAVRAPKAAKTVKVKPAKAAKTVAAKVAKAVKPTAPTKSPDEIERIKAANLARMKEVMSRNKKMERRSATNEAETPTVTEDSDPFAAPAFLTRDELTALV